jgi:ABC-type lipoprotein release transport system permease subunit
MGRLLLIAARNLRQNKKRTLFLGSAICLVTMLLVILTGISNGIQDTMLRAATTLSTGHVNVAGFFKVTSGQAAPVVSKYAPLKAFSRQETPEAYLVVDRLRGWGKIVSTTTSIQVGIGGVEIESETGLAQVLSIVRGKLADLARPNTLLLFESQAKRLEVDVRDTVTVSTQTVRGAHNAVDVEVVAIAKDMGLLSSFNVFTTKNTVREMYLLDKSATGAIQLYLKDPAHADRVAARLRARIAEKNYRVMEPDSKAFWMKFPIVTREDWTGQKIDVTTWKDEMSMLTWVVTAFDAITWTLVVILLIIIVIGVMNTLWIAIRERTREIGTLRAIGMSRPLVALMFLMEAALLSFCATLVGIVLGSGVALILNGAEIKLSEGFAVFLMSDKLRLVIAGGSGAAALLVITCFTTFFAIFPALRAARLRPVTAIHHVG